MLDDKTSRQRIRLLILAIGVVGIIVIFRLFTLQVVNSREYQERAEHQYVTPSGAVFDRGNIYFTKKDGETVAAATIATGFKVAIAPRQITDEEGVYKKLAAIIELDKSRFLEQAAKKNDPYEEIAERVDEEAAEKITALQIPGVTLYRQKWRFYPGGTLAAKTIGFVSYKGNDLVGNYGLEEYYNDVLSRSADNFYVNFFAEIFANMQSTIFKNRAATGDIVTSIEPSAQAELENQVASVISKWNSDSVGAIVMDPYTGEIIAIAAAPSFDLNAFGEERDVSVYGNPFTQNVYEMGSIVKPLVMAAGIDSGAVTPATSYNDTGSVQVQDKLINNFDKKGRGHVTMQDVLNQSLNTGMVYVQQHMGKETFREYMLDRYRIGEKTGVDIPGEVKGLVSNLKTPYDVNFATAAFGQGIATTPINIVRGFASIANGGTLVTPHLATKIEEENGTTRPVKYIEYPLVMKPETAATVTNMLVKVVDDGYHLKQEHYRVAAKTGTAQIAKPNGQGYYDDRNLHSLIGYFPATKPRFVVYFFNVHPKGAQFAIQTLADPFFNMIQFLATYYEIAPDR
jgi:cell division protein FtsI/penicillin-binding protein 2